MPTYEVDLAATTASARTFDVDVADGAVVWSRLPSNINLNIPPITDQSQIYYWKLAWQHDEAEALEDLAAGRVRAFDDPEAAVRYLLNDED